MEKAKHFFKDFKLCLLEGGGGRENKRIFFGWERERNNSGGH